jgi:hypothetical protein
MVIDYFLLHFRTAQNMLVMMKEKQCILDLVSDSQQYQ